MDRKCKYESRIMHLIELSPNYRYFRYEEHSQRAVHEPTSELSVGERGEVNT